MLMLILTTVLKQLDVDVDLGVDMLWLSSDSCMLMLI